MKPPPDEVLSDLRNRQDFLPAAKRVRIILKQISRRKNLSILDAGCRPGWVSHFLEKTGLQTVLLDAIEQVSSLSRCISEVWRVLRPGGKLLMTTPNKFGTYTMIYDVIGRSLFEKEISDHVHYFSVNGLRSKLVESGFKVERVENIELLSPLHRAVSRSLKYGKNLACYLSKMDVLLSDSMPEQMVSEWFIIADRIDKA